MTCAPQKVRSNKQHWTKQASSHFMVNPRKYRANLSVAKTENKTPIADQPPMQGHEAMKLTSVT
jgi:hypothetical protein